MRGVNLVIVCGNLGADPETRYGANGGAITTIRLATSESWKDKQTGQTQERTEWHRVKLFGRLGEIAAEYLSKGKQVYIQGSLRTDKYTDKDGVERYTTEIIASEMQMLGNAAPGQGAHSGNGQRAGGEDRAPRGGRDSGGRNGASHRGAPQPPPMDGEGEGFGERIPF